MRIDRRSFCGLSNSEVWQHWLSDYDHDLFIKFLDQLKSNKGCNDNQKLMDSILNTIMARAGGEDDIRDFLDRNFPFMILDRTGYNRAIIGELRDYFASHILTFPHRHILYGNDLEKRVMDFCSSKLSCLYLIADDVAFVEYLDVSDRDFAEDIPARSWLLSKYKVSRRINDVQ